MYKSNRTPDVIRNEIQKLQKELDRSLAFKKDEVVNVTAYVVNDVGLDDRDMSVYVFDSRGNKQSVIVEATEVEKINTFSTDGPKVESLAIPSEPDDKNCKWMHSSNLDEHHPPTVVATNDVVKAIKDGVGSNPFVDDDARTAVDSIVELPHPNEIGIGTIHDAIMKAVPWFFESEREQLLSIASYMVHRAKTLPDGDKTK